MKDYNYLEDELNKYMIRDLSRIVISYYSPKCTSFKESVKCGDFIGVVKSIPKLRSNLNLRRTYKILGGTQYIEIIKFVMNELKDYGVPWNIALRSVQSTVF